jgi:replicative DNA helicase
MSLPNNLEAERASLGSFLIDSGVTYLGLPLLKPEFFYEEKNRRVFEAIQEVSQDGQPVDFVTVLNKLQEYNKLEALGGVDYLTELMESTPSSLHIEYYAGIVKNYYKLRELIVTSRRIGKEAEIAKPDEVSLVLDKSLESLYAVFSEADANSIVNSRTMMQEFWKHFEMRFENPGQVETSTGYIELDAVIDGYAPTDLVIVAGRPSWGKTSFVMNSMLRLARNSIPSVLFAYEMSTLQSEQRFISIDSGVGLQKIKTATGLSSEELNKITRSTANLAEYPMWIDSNTTGDIYYLASAIRRYVQQYEVKVIFIDFLQIIPTNTDDLVREYGKITRMLKNLATSLGIVVVLASQLNRLIEHENRKPRLSDLRDSGNIEEHADVVLFTYRQPTGDAPEEAELIIGKNRNGPIGSFSLFFDEESTRFLGRE